VRKFWPPAEGAQADYEALRAAVLAGTPAAEVAAARFARGGLAALIARPVADPVFVATLRGAPRPAWTPHRSEGGCAGCWLRAPVRRN
jgi:hypothetical protein